MQAEKDESFGPSDVQDVETTDSRDRTSKRAMKLFADLKPEEEQSMVEWLTKNPLVYNKKLVAYKDITRKERLWKDKATELQKPVKLLKLWYTSVRSRYGRLKKRCGEDVVDLTEREEWILRNFDFLRPFIYEVKQRIKKYVSVTLHSFPDNLIARVELRTDLHVDLPYLHLFI